MVTQTTNQSTFEIIHAALSPTLQGQKTDTYNMAIQSAQERHLFAATLQILDFINETSIVQLHPNFVSDTIKRFDLFKAYFLDSKSQIDSANENISKILRFSVHHAILFMDEFEEICNNASLDIVKESQLVTYTNLKSNIWKIFGNDGFIDLPSDDQIVNLDLPSDDHIVNQSSVSNSTPIVSMESTTSTNCMLQEIQSISPQFYDKGIPQSIDLFTEEDQESLHVVTVKSPKNSSTSSSGNHLITFGMKFLNLRTQKLLSRICVIKVQSRTRTDRNTDSSYLTIANHRPHFVLSSFTFMNYKVHLELSIHAINYMFVVS